MLFERFLNPERVSPPDFDVDFCEERRSEVIEYVRQKYGAASVAQICTYGTLKAKAVIKDVARVLGYDFAFGDSITKLIPADPKMTLEKARTSVPELKAMIEGNSEVANVFEFAEILEGINRQLGIHAAGVIIGDQPLAELIPLARGANGETITQFPAGPCEELGLLKMDFLGLRTLTIINNACKMIEQTRGVKIDFNKVPIDDQKTFDLLRAGNTIAVFQLESGGMQDLCRNFGVDTIEHIIALLAIYRPGPMAFIPAFIARKKGLETIEYDHPKMRARLEETYGIMLYQEQIMQVVQELAGFTLGGADILRRAIGKKKADVLEKQKKKFVDGCLEHNNIDEQLADQIWAKIEMFAGYGFNKSHSAAYALISYRTAYLKANYPVEFMAAVLTSEIHDAEKIAFLIHACKAMKINVLPPDINSSSINFGVDGDNIRFGIGAIKGVGEAAAGAVINARNRDGKFTSFADFCERCGDAINSRMLESLIMAGACDVFDLRRSQLMAVSESTMRYAQSQARDRAAGQMSLFEMLDQDSQDEIMNIPVPDIPEFDADYLLKSEKELLGFYVTGHPLTKYMPIFSRLNAQSELTKEELEQLENGETVQYGIRIGGMVSVVTKKNSKKTQRPYLIIKLETLQDSVEAMMYERAMQSMYESGMQLEKGDVVYIEAIAEKQGKDGQTRLIVEKILSVDAAMEEYCKEILIFSRASNITPEILEKFKVHSRFPRGDASVVFVIDTLENSRIYLRSGMRVAANTSFLNGVEAIFGEESWKLEGNDKIPTPRRYDWKKKKEEEEKKGKGQNS